jgi:hypothetical protein
MTGDTSLTVASRIDARPIRWRRRLAWSFVVVMLLSVAAVWHGGARGRLIADIESKGGLYSEWHSTTPFLRPFVAVLGVQDYSQYTVHLVGADVDDAWLAAHNDLADLHPNCLGLGDTRLSTQSIHRLLQKYQLERFLARGVPVTDGEAVLLGDDVDLMELTLRKTQVTDAGLRLIPMAKVYRLDVSGSPITASAIEECLSGKGLRWIVLDGGQFTPELATFLGTIPWLQQIELVGPEVTDEHLKLLPSMSALAGLWLEETSVTHEAIAAIRKAHPGWRIYVDGKQIQP